MPGANESASLIRIYLIETPDVIRKSRISGKLTFSRFSGGWSALENAAVKRAGEARIDHLKTEGMLTDGSADAIRRAFTPVRCYSLRHSYATQLLLQGSDDLSLVQEALGHRDARTTRIYTTVKVNPRLTAAVRKAFVK